MVALARAGDAYLVEHLDRLVGEREGARLRVLLQHVLDLTANLADRIQRRAWVLKDHRHLAPAQVAHLLFAGGAHVDPSETHRAFDDASGTVKDTHDRIGGDRFSRAGLTDDTNRLALADTHVDVLHRAHHAAPGAELDGEVRDIEQRHGLCHSASSRAPLRIDNVAQPISEQVEAEDGDHQRGAGKQRNPPFA